MNSEIALQMCSSTLWAYTQREACCSAPPTEFQSCMKTIFTMPHLKFGQAKHWQQQLWQRLLLCAKNEVE